LAQQRRLQLDRRQNYKTSGTVFGTNGEGRHSVRAPVLMARFDCSRKVSLYDAKPTLFVPFIELLSHVLICCTSFL